MKNTRDGWRGIETNEREKKRKGSTRKKRKKKTRKEE